MNYYPPAIQQIGIISKKQCSCLEIGWCCRKKQMDSECGKNSQKTANSSESDKVFGDYHLLNAFKISSKSTQ